ncbi:hypothetical protein RRG08_053457 [Elysia crispata]|uniref:Uncharacterized protein n=1 Tax=Elysia crispata TaxID=231223 RepID=A0AAE0XN75_9GAST|nr:hypothetical protein RRG08_053457 [Elysia crispata]
MDIGTQLIGAMRKSKQTSDQTRAKFKPHVTKTDKKLTVDDSRKACPKCTLQASMYTANKSPGAWFVNVEIKDQKILMKVDIEAKRPKAKLHDLVKSGIICPVEEPTGWVNCLVIAQKRWQPKTVPRSQGSHAEQFEISAFEQIVGLGGKNLNKRIHTGR